MKGESTRTSIRDYRLWGPDEEFAIVRSGKNSSDLQDPRRRLHYPANSGPKSNPEMRLGKRRFIVANRDDFRFPNRRPRDSYGGRSKFESVLGETATLSRPDQGRSSNQYDLV